MGVTRPVALPEIFDGDDRVVIHEEAAGVRKQHPREADAMGGKLRASGRVVQFATRLRLSRRFYRAIIRGASSENSVAGFPRDVFSANS